jgi:hypothetical protein
MIVTVKIDTNTSDGKRLEKELRRYPETVQFIEPSNVAEPNALGDVLIQDCENQVGENEKSISATESAKLAFDRLGKKYNRKFNNKYTR